jgi:hypothetical protein
MVGSRIRLQPVLQPQAALHLAEAGLLTRRPQPQSIFVARTRRGSFSRPHCRGTLQSYRFLEPRGTGLLALICHC